MPKRVIVFFFLFLIYYFLSVVISAQSINKAAANKTYVILLGMVIHIQTRLGRGRRLQLFTKKEFFFLMPAQELCARLIKQTFL